MFENKVNYSEDEWKKFLNFIKKDELGNDIFIGNNESTPHIMLIYKVNNNARTINHIASYDMEKGILYCNYIGLIVYNYVKVFVK